MNSFRKAESKNVIWCFVMYKAAKKIRKNTEQCNFHENAQQNFLLSLQEILRLVCVAFIKNYKIGLWVQNNCSWSVGAKGNKIWIWLG